MVPYRASRLVLTMRSPLYAPCSRNPWPIKFPYCSPMSWTPHWDFSLETIPHELQGAPQFLLNNPIALQVRYLEPKDAPNVMGQGRIYREAVKVGEQGAPVTATGGPTSQMHKSAGK